MTARILSETASREVRALLDTHGLCLDVAFRGEILRMVDGKPGLRRRYIKRAGLTVDALGELIWDRRITDSRPSCDEVLNMLDAAFTSAPARSPRVRVSRAACDAAEQKARSMRLRKFVCPNCQQIARASKSSVLACGLCYEMSGEVHIMQRVDPLPEEIAAAVAAEMERAA